MACRITFTCWLACLPWCQFQRLSASLKRILPGGYMRNGRSTHPLHGSLDMALSALVNRESLLFSDTFIIRSDITASSHINKNSLHSCGNKGLNTTNATSGNDYAARFAGFVEILGWGAGRAPTASHSSRCGLLL